MLAEEDAGERSRLAEFRISHAGIGVSKDTGMLFLTG
jgi:hypothetical protein